MDGSKEQQRRIMREYSVASTNVFNMDETGWMFGLGASERVLYLLVI